MRPVFCDGCGAIFSNGIYSLSSYLPWESGQSGPEDIRRDQTLSVPLPSFGKLNLPDKLAFSAASLALQGKSDIGGDKSGICIAIPYGTLTTDMLFMESVVKEFPSPSFFSATLPSSAIVDIAIYYKFKGPDRVFSGGDNPLIETISSALQLIKTGKADSILALAVWAFDKSNRQLPSDFRVCENSAFAFLLTSAPSVETSPKIDIRIENQQERYDTQSELQFCIRLLQFFRDKEKGNIPLSPDKLDNYLSVT